MTPQLHELDEARRAARAQLRETLGAVLAQCSPSALAARSKLMVRERAQRAVTTTFDSVVRHRGVLAGAAAATAALAVFLYLAKSSQPSPAETDNAPSPKIEP